MERQSLLSAYDVTYEFAVGKTLFSGINTGINQGDKIALIGANGIGKSTLLKILAGQIQPSSGSVVSHSCIYYLPQISTIDRENKDITVLDFICSLSEEWWQITNILESRLDTKIDFSVPIGSLSGGELTKLFLAIGLSREPNVLLLDEPTNHLDFLALENLSHFLNEFSGAFVIISHKPFFLDQVANTTWELTAKRIKVYGGNFSLYKDQKEAERQAALRTQEIAKKELKRATESALREQQRAARSSREGRIQAFDGSMGKAAQHFFANRASASAGSSSKKHDTAMKNAVQKVEDSKLRKNKATAIHLDEGSSKRGKNLIDIQGATLKVGSQSLIDDIHLHISYGERIAISGSNGSGKSSLIQGILSSRKEANSITSLDGDNILVSDGIKIVSLDQNYQLINREKTVLENMQQANSSLNYQLLRQQLGSFLFLNDEVHKIASVLSGGELARLALAIVSISEIDLLILDEPTNNLDIETVNQIVEALDLYKGALLVISHDQDFLSRIGITKAFKLKEKAFKATDYLPHEVDEYYQELLY